MTLKRADRGRYLVKINEDLDVICNTKSYAYAAIANASPATTSRHGPAGYSSGTATQSRAEAESRRVRPHGAIARCERMLAKLRKMHGEVTQRILLLDLDSSFSDRSHGSSGHSSSADRNKIQLAEKELLAKIYEKIQIAEKELLCLVAG
ncbi:unnamed protein product [Amoebophrya sp. A120]|nr:unnamed protein product [Amoebophrya sp. A120]